MQKRFMKKIKKKSSSSTATEIDNQTEYLESERRFHVCISNPESWGYKEVGEWLEQIGMPQLVLPFKEERIAGDVLFNLDKELLKELGIESLGKVKQLLSKIEDLKNNREEKKTFCLKMSKKEKKQIRFTKSFKLAQSLVMKKANPKKVCKWNVQETCTWMEENSLGIFSNLFLNQQIDGEILLGLTSEDLESIGILEKHSQLYILLQLEKLK